MFASALEPRPWHMTQFYHQLAMRDLLASWTSQSNYFPDDVYTTTSTPRPPSQPSTQQTLANKKLDGHERAHQHLMSELIKTRPRHDESATRCDGAHTEGAPSRRDTRPPSPSATSSSASCTGSSSPRDHAPTSRRTSAASTSAGARRSRTRAACCCASSVCAPAAPTRCWRPRTTTPGPSADCPPTPSPPSRVAGVGGRRPPRANPPPPPRHLPPTRQTKTASPTTRPRKGRAARGTRRRPAPARRRRRHRHLRHHSRSPDASTSS